jgi:hypothetical protein
MWRFGQETPIVKHNSHTNKKPSCHKKGARHKHNSVHEARVDSTPTKTTLVKQHFVTTTANNHVEHQQVRLQKVRRDHSKRAVGQFDAHKCARVQAQLSSEHVDVESERVDSKPRCA